MPLWVSPMNSTVRLEVPPTATSTPTGVFSQWYEALFPHTGTQGCMVCCRVYQLLPLWHLQLCHPCSTICHLAGSASHCLATSPLRPGCPSLPFLLVWINVSSLSPWLLDFHRVRFSVSSGFFFFFNCCCPSFCCAWKCSVSTYASILAGSSEVLVVGFEQFLPEYKLTL